MSATLSPLTLRRFLGTALVAMALSPVVLSADVQTGKWKVSSSQGNLGIYVNATGASQTVMATVCNTAGGTVSVQFSGANVANVMVGACSTRSATLANNASIDIHLTGTTATNGTYSVSVLH